MNQENTKSLNTRSVTPRRKILEKNKLSFEETPTRKKNDSSKRESSISGGRKVASANSREENISSSGGRVHKKENIVLSDEKSSLTPQVGTPGGTPYMLRSKTKELKSSDKRTPRNEVRSNISKKDIIMPPLDLSNGSNNESEFYKFDENINSNENDNVKNNNNLSESSVYSTPKKRARVLNMNEGGVDNKLSRMETNEKEKNDIGLNDVDILNSNSTGRRQGSSRNNIKSTPRTRRHENTSINNGNNVDDCTVKDRKSILKQYDPDNVNTTTMSNIKTPKSQKKVQFGVKNLIIIDESLQEDNANKLYLNNRDTLSDMNLNNGDRMSILSEFDDPGSGNIAYNFPSLEELIGKDESSKEDSAMNTKREICAIDRNSVIDSSDCKSNIVSINNDSNIEITRKNETKVNCSNKEKINLQFENNENLDITDQINISNYSISCRDSITPNTPGAFLSVVMKNLSSVNFSDDKKDEIEDIIEEEMEKNEDCIQEDNNMIISEIGNENNNNTEIENSNIETTLEVINENINLEENSFLNDKKIVYEETVVKESIDINNEHSDNKFNEKLIETLENESKVEDDRNENVCETSTRLNELLTPKTRYSNSRNTAKKTLSPRSESLLNSLYNAKSILNIVPKGYTWEEFLSLLNLNYTMDSFNMLEFNDLDIVSTTGIMDVINENSNNDNKVLINQLNNFKENTCYKEAIEKYKVQLIKSIKSQIWEDIEKEKLMKVYTDVIFENKYKNNLLKFPESELATVLAIIVNKSRYGSKQDEKIKNELLNRLSTYFSIENGNSNSNTDKDSKNNVFYIESWLYWNEEIIFPYKKSLLKKYDEYIKKFMDINEQIIIHKNRIQNSYVLMSTLESCQISEMHVNETYWDAMKLIHENINNYKEEINRMNNYIKVMTNNKNNLNKLLIKEEELSNSLISELNSWKYKKNNLKSNLNSLRIKEEFAGFTWDLFTINKFQTIISLHNNSQYPVKIRVAIEWNINGDFEYNKKETQNDDSQSPPVILNIELINYDYESSKDNRLFVNSNYQLQNNIYQAYVKIIEKTLNLRLNELYTQHKKQNNMNNNILIELIRGIFQSCTILLWRSESIVFEILNIIKVFNLAILDIDENNSNTLIMNIPILIGINSDKVYGISGNNNNSNANNGALSSPLLSNNSAAGTILSPITPNSLTSKLSPHLLISTRPIISIKFNITNSLFNSIGTLANSIQDVHVYNVNEDICHNMVRIFKEQIHEIELNKNKTFSAVYLGYNCLLSIIQNTIQEGGKNQLIWKRPLEKFAPRLLNAVQISKLHQNY
ncbi:hypothetical protein RS030_1120 [Cryptosporidium xiaoi]|uniref:Spc7 kinetochore protein domain-containing protein n=1 Tax=Cryptosporidium xiaoi TaxID=659607 RepID=A0AAV9XYB3_9CRYT